VHPEVVVGIAFLAGLYAAAWAVRGERLAAGRVLAFSGGLVVLLGTLNGPLHDLSDHYLFSAHMLQHLLLTLVVPPLLLLGMPGWMLDAALRPLLGWTPARAVIRTVARPVPALAVYTVTLVAWHLPPLYGAALMSHPVHVLQHLTLMAAAVLAWWPVLSSARTVPAIPYGAQILYLFAFGMPMTVVAAMITGAEHVLYPYYATALRLIDPASSGLLGSLGPSGPAGALDPLADQRLGGVIMWVPAGVVPLIAFTVVFFRWAAEEPDEPGALVPPAGSGRPATRGQQETA
jgi:putative membrane protein